jgi:hypothetical protein
VLSLPQLEGEDRPEGLAVFDESRGSTTVMVVFDTPSAARKPDATTVLANLYRLP